MLKKTLLLLGTISFFWYFDPTNFSETTECTKKGFILVYFNEELMSPNNKRN